jgi:hypothetical protein
MKRPRRTPRTSALSAGMLGVNASEDPRPRDDGGGIGPLEIGFLTGFLLVCAGLAMIWWPLAFLFAGVLLAFVTWRLA